MTDMNLGAGQVSMTIIKKDNAYGLLLRPTRVVLPSGAMAHPDAQAGGVYEQLPGDMVLWFGRLESAYIVHDLVSLVIMKIKGLVK